MWFMVNGMIVAKDWTDPSNAMDVQLELKQ